MQTLSWNRYTLVMVLLFGTNNPESKFKSRSLRISEYSKRGFKPVLWKVTKIWYAWHFDLIMFYEKQELFSMTQLFTVALNVVGGFLCESPFQCWNCFDNLKPQECGWVWRLRFREWDIYFSRFLGLHFIPASCFQSLLLPSLFIPLFHFFHFFLSFLSFLSFSRLLTFKFVYKNMCSTSWSYQGILTDIQFMWPYNC